MYFYTYFPCLPFVPCEMYVIGLYIICFLKFMYQIYINIQILNCPISYFTWCMWYTLYT